jgi:hypothetical protein
MIQPPVAPTAVGLVSRRRVAHFPGIFGGHSRRGRSFGRLRQAACAPCAFSWRTPPARPDLARHGRGHGGSWSVCARHRHRSDHRGSRGRGPSRRGGPRWPACAPRSSQVPGSCGVGSAPGPRVPGSCGDLGGRGRGCRGLLAPPARGRLLGHLVPAGGMEATKIYGHP